MRRFPNRPASPKMAQLASAAESPRVSWSHPSAPFASTMKRFSSARAASAPSPGHYDPVIQQKTRTPVFCGGGPRLAAQVSGMVRTRHGMKPTPAPDAYITTATSKATGGAVAVFKSKTARTLAVSDNPPPGLYNLAERRGQTGGVAAVAPFKATPRTMNLLSLDTPAPGFYEPRLPGTTLGDLERFIHSSIIHHLQ
jgi:hypothetical protein